MSEIFRINTPTVVSEIIDGEAVIVHFDTGSYYSLQHSGAFLWSCLEKGMSESDLLETVRRSFPELPDGFETGIRAFLEELKREDLLVPAKGDTPSDGPSGIQAPADSAFVPPQLLKFTDMQQLLLLDPIHEVDQKGWPHRDADKTE